MRMNGSTLILVADGRRARLYEEPRRGADLIQRAAHDIADEDLYAPQDRPPRTFESATPHRSAMEKRDLHEAEEENFLRRVAGLVGEAMGAFDHLVVIAPPRALGLLRAGLPEAAGAKIAHTLAKDVVSEDAVAIKRRLGDLRLP